MKKTLTLVALLLFALAACSAPATGSGTELRPDESQPSAIQEPGAVEEPATAEESAPSEELVEIAPTTQETGAAADEVAAAAEPTCNPADIPAATGGGVMIRFLNLSGVDLTGVWHNTTQSPAQLVDYFQLGDREFVDQETFVGEEWLLRRRVRCPSQLDSAGLERILGRAAGTLPSPATGSGVPWVAPPGRPAPRGRPPPGRQWVISSRAPPAEVGRPGMPRPSPPARWSPRARPR